MLRTGSTAGEPPRDDDDAGNFGTVFGSVGGEAGGARSTSANLEPHLHDPILRLVSFFSF